MEKKVKLEKQYRALYMQRCHEEESVWFNAKDQSLRRMDSPLYNQDYMHKSSFCKTKKEAMMYVKNMIDLCKPTKKTKVHSQRCGMIGYSWEESVEDQLRFEVVKWKIQMRYVSKWEDQ